MTAVQTFDTWYSALTTKEKQEVIEHVFHSKLSLTTEGIFSGPAGEIVKKGFFGGPSGQLGGQKCPYCGK